jgi:hypothetical protein
MKNQNSTCIEALRKQIQVIAFDANLFDLGIADYPHARHCSEKRKKLNSEIVRLGGEEKPLPFQTDPAKFEVTQNKSTNKNKVNTVQLDLFGQ